MCFFSALVQQMKILHSYVIKPTGSCIQANEHRLLPSLFAVLSRQRAFEQKQCVNSTQKCTSKSVRSTHKRSLTSDLLQSTLSFLSFSLSLFFSLFHTHTATFPSLPLLFVSQKQRLPLVLSLCVCFQAGLYCYKIATLSSLK